MDTSKVRYLRALMKAYYSYKTKKSTLSYLPIRLWIEPTNICNLKCVMCLNKSLKNRGYMDFEVYKKIVDEAKDFVFDVNLFHRGESMLHPRIYDMIKYANKNGIYTRLFTNATRLDGKNAKNILDSGLDFISFSFDGYTKEEYEKIRVGSDFDKTIANITNFLKLKETKRNKPYVMFESIEFSNEDNDLKKKRVGFKNRLKTLPLNKFAVRSPHNWGGDYTIPIDKNPKTFLPCTFLWYALTILYDGSVLPCPQDFFGELKLGNINDESIKRIWNNDKVVPLREAMVTRNYQKLVPCSNCDRIFRKNFFGIPVPYLRALFYGKF
jgi:radical SAM protein with 4Fe4S-binding SPASM domain